MLISDKLVCDILFTSYSQSGGWERKATKSLGGTKYIARSGYICACVKKL